MGKIDVVKAEKELELEIRYNPSNYLPYINRAIVYMNIPLENILRRVG